VTAAASNDGRDLPALADQVKGAVIWRSGSQLAGQLIAWASTFLVIRLLDPSDYGLLAMTGVVLAFLNLLNGWGFASALVREESTDKRRIRQAFGMLLLVNGTLAAIQFAAAPLAADFFHQPMVERLLRVQALFYLANPFLALGNALLARRMDFKRQSQINLGAAVLSACSAVAAALCGMGVWTLVIAAGVLWFTQALGLTVAARLWLMPLFSFRGAGDLARFGGAMMLVQFFWFVQSQTDVFLGGHVLDDAHRLGLYTTALFLTQILSAKFVPAINDVAYAAYSRLQADPERLRAAFLKTVRLVMLLAMPFYFGLAVTAEPLVVTFLGDKWREAAALVPPLACAMAVATLQILFAAATNAIGQPKIAVRTGLFGAAAMAAAFTIGIRWGAEGLAVAWIAGAAALLAATMLVSLPAIGATRRALAASVAPGLCCALVMAAAVAAADAALQIPSEGVRLALLVPFGAALYALLLFLFARPVADEVLALVRPVRRAPAAAQAL
jgi:O-antigen/teichoic acid export membrane protein